MIKGRFKWFLIPILAGCLLGGALLLKSWVASRFVLFRNVPKFEHPLEEEILQYSTKPIYKALHSMKAKDTQEVLPRLEKFWLLSEKEIQTLRTRYAELLARLKASSKIERPVIRGLPQYGNAWDFYRKALKLLEKMTEQEKALLPRLSGVPETPLNPDKVLAVYERYKEVFELVRQGVQQLYVDPGTYEWPASPNIEDYSKLVKFFKFLSDVAESLSQKGHINKALDMLTDGLRFSQDIGYGGPLIMGLASIGTSEITTACIEGIINNALITPPRLLQLNQELDNILSTMPRYTQAADIEAIEVTKIVVDLLDKLEKQMDQGRTPKEFWEEVLVPLGAKSGYRGPWQELPTHFVKGSFQLMDMWEQVKALPQLPYLEHQKRLREILKTVDQENMAVWFFLPSLERLLEVHTVQLARLRGLKLAVALRRYVKERGYFPRDLDDLYRAGYLLHPPLRDPFTELPFRYKIRKDGLSVILYSMGPNLKDDGGILKGELDIVLSVRR
jgi:hypothetical protein